MVCAAALALMMVLQEEQLVDNAARVGSHFERRLRDLEGSTGEIREVRGKGLMLAIELKRSAAREVVLACLERGYVVNNIGGEILRFLPPLSISTHEVDGLVEVLEELLPGGPRQGTSGEV